MSTEPITVHAPAPSDGTDTAVDAHVNDKPEPSKQASPNFLHSPPDSNNAHKSDATDSELSDLDDEEPVLPDADQLRPAAEPTVEPSLPIKDEAEVKPEEEEEEDIGEVLPDHWSGAVAVFKPTMHQFKDFKRFMSKVNSYGMKSGIIKIIPPPEWKSKQPPLDDLIKGVRVREPIKQDIMGSNGTYRQVNILHGRSYNVPQWRQLCDQSEHQPPARRGERRANAEKPKTQRRPAAPKPANPATPNKKRGRKPGRKRGRPSKKAVEDDDDERPMTPVSPKPEEHDAEDVEGEVVDSVEQDAAADTEAADSPAPTGRLGRMGRMGGARQPKNTTQSVSARRKYSKREGSAMIDEAAFRDFDYQMDITDYTPERCEELERAYWKTLTYAAPLYGADMMGTLFDDRTETWNLNRLPNLLDVLGTKIPGVNTAYLYFGMWKATFAWHLEDVDLYSINYVHFGAPKQWYSISQADARRFEAAMKNIWPADAKACNQFLRHKGYLISPQHLLQNYGIKVNKVVSYPGEFVVTFPYGYHSGYNLGYNCAEAVNFALEPWLEMGKIAKRCECAEAQDSVWINVYEIERKMRGEETEYEETEDDDDDEDDEDDEEGGTLSGLPSPPASHGVKFKTAPRKRKRAQTDKEPKTKIKRIKLRLKTKAEPPCCLCPNDIPSMDMLPTDDGRKVHRVCALYLPETYIDDVDGKEVVSNISGVHKDRTELKCLFCRSKKGACFQCSHHKCTRAYHATCAAAAGVFVEEGEVPVFGEDQTEYKEQAFEFSCRFHRVKRDKKLDGDALEKDSRIKEAASALKGGEFCQFQFLKGEIFAGSVVENRPDEQMLLVSILPSGDRFEVEWKWLLLPDPSDYHLPKASANAIPLPSSRKAKDKLNAKRSMDDKPRKDDPFTDGTIWAEFNLHEVERNKEQVKIDFAKSNQIWYYLPKRSTEARDQYSDDPTNKSYNPSGNFLDTVPKPPPKAVKSKSATAPKQQAHGLNETTHPTQHTNLGAPTATWAGGRSEKPYVYKPKKPVGTSFDASGTYTQQRYTIVQSHPLPSNFQQPHQYQQPPQNPAVFVQQRFEPKPSHVGISHEANPRQGGAAPRMIDSQSPVPAAPVQRVQSTARVINGPSTPSATVPNAQSRQGSKLSWQIHPIIYQKYPFFQVHHNRDSTKYRTPYAPWGGFTNGYEGDLRAHLMANSSHLMRHSSFGSGSHTGQGRPVPAPSTPYSSPYGAQPAAPSAASPAPRAPAARIGSLASQPPQTSAQQHPAAASEQTASSQAQNGQLSNGKAKPPPASKPYKIPPKQSPVPLPANFLAAMTASPNPPSASSPSPAPRTNPQVITSVASGMDLNKGPTNVRSSPASTQLNRPSTTPIPVPSFPRGMPPQAATKMSPARTPIAVPVVSGHEYSSTPSNTTHPAAVSYDMTVGSSKAMPPQNLGAWQQQPPNIKSVTDDAVQEFPDVPGSESMEFMENMMANLRRVVRLDT